MASILELVGRLTLNKTGFDAGMMSAQKAADKFSNSASKKFAQAFSVAAIVAFTREIIDTGKEIDELADKLGVTAERAQEIRLRDKLGGDAGAGGVLMSPQALEDLRVADRLMIKLRETAKSAAVNIFAMGAAGANNPIAAVARIGLSLAKKTGFVSSAPTTTRRDEIARNAHMATQDRIVSLEKEAADLNKRAMFTRLTDEQQLNALLEERVNIQRSLKTTGVLSEEGVAMQQKRLAELNLDVAQQQKRQGAGRVSISGGTPGVFVGNAASAGRPALAQVELLRDIKAALIQRGIVIRDKR